MGIVWRSPGYFLACLVFLKIYNCSRCKQLARYVLDPSPKACHCTKKIRWSNKQKHIWFSKQIVFLKIGWIAKHFMVSYCSGIPVLQSEVKFEISSSGSISWNQFIISFLGGTLVFREEIWYRTIRCHIKPRISLPFPFTISSFPENHTWKYTFNIESKINVRGNGLKYRCCHVHKA